MFQADHFQIYILLEGCLCKKGCVMSIGPHQVTCITANPNALLLESKMGNDLCGRRLHAPATVRVGRLGWPGLIAVI